LRCAAILLAERLPPARLHDSLGANLESLRKHAKNWLKALKGGDPVARERLAAAWSKAPASPTLRDVQHALALEHGFTGWAALKEELANRAAARLTPEERLAIVLRTPWDAGHRSTVGRSLGNWHLADFVEANASKIGERLVIAIR
jgi:hypothetical protein